MLNGDSVMHVQMLSAAADNDDAGGKAMALTPKKKKQTINTNGDKSSTA